MLALKRQFGVTLIELLIAIAIVGVLAMIGFPSISRFLETQRVKSVSSEILEDLQFARAETVARRRSVGLSFRRTAGSQACYTVAIIADGDCVTAGGSGDLLSNCNCLNGAGAACSAGRWTEIKTVLIPAARKIDLKADGAFSAVAFDPTSGNVSYCFANLTGSIPPEFVAKTIGTGTGAEVRVEVGAAGRARACKSAGTFTGMATC